MMEIFSHKCSICGTIFEDNIKPNVTIKLKKHLMDEHCIDYKTYILNTFHGGVNPTCACGCGEEVNFKAKNALFDESHGFRKYVTCAHAGRNRHNTIKNKVFKWDDKNWVLEYYENLYGIENIISAFIKFMDGMGASEVSKEQNMDVRTMRGSWVRLGLITKEELDKESKKRKGIVSNSKRKIKFDNYEEICEDLFFIIKNHPQKYNIRSLIKYYNKTNKTKLEVDPTVVNRTLIDCYGETIYDYLQFGSHSKEELDLLNVLQYYFSKYKIICGKRIYYGSKTKKEYYSYDFCLGNKLIIEYDGSGYYHSDQQTIEHDKIKENFAIKNGYVFMRVSDAEAKNIELLLKIKKILEND